MAIWVNAAKRLPEEKRLYFVKINGVRELYHLEEIKSKLTRLAKEDKILWLDETKQLPDLETTPPKVIEKVVEKIVYAEGGDYISDLRKIFGCEKNNGT